METSNLDRAQLLHDIESLKLALTDREQVCSALVNKMQFIASIYVLFRVLF